MPIYQDSENHQVYEPGDIVFTAGCFDLFHLGHLRLLERAKELGGRLHVAVLADEYIRSYKGKSRPINTEVERLQVVRAIRFVDRAWLAYSSPNSDETIVRVMPRVVVYGTPEGEAEKAKSAARCERLLRKFPRMDIQLFARFQTGDVSTSKIVKRVLVAEAHASVGLEVLK